MSMRRGFAATIAAALLAACAAQSERTAPAPTAAAEPAAPEVPRGHIAIVAEGAGHAIGARVDRRGVVDALARKRSVLRASKKLKTDFGLRGSSEGFQKDAAPG